MLLFCDLYYKSTQRIYTSTWTEIKCVKTKTDGWKIMWIMVKANKAVSTSVYNLWLTAFSKKKASRWNLKRVLKTEVRASKLKYRRDALCCVCSVTTCTRSFKQLYTPQHYFSPLTFCVYTLDFCPCACLYSVGVLLIMIAKQYQT